MRLLPLRSLCSTAAPLGACLALLTLALPAAAQQGQQGGGASAQEQETKVVPTIRTPVYDQLNNAQICMDEGDYECATEILDRVARMRDLNNYQTAQLWNFRAYLYFGQENVEGAIEAYEKILAIPFEDMPDGLISNSMRNLATLYIEQERWDEGLAMFIRWMELPTTTPSENDYILLAQIYYQMERYADSIPAIHEAIDMANAAGEIGEEQWYQLLYACHFQLEQTPQVIETLTFLVEHWTKRQWVIALAGQLSQQDRDADTLTLWEAAYDAGWLTQGRDLVVLASLYMNNSTPYKAAVLLDDGLSDGTIESTETNWRQLANAWVAAAEHERSVPALEHASTLSDDGEIDRLLAQAYSRLARYEDCSGAARRALDRGVDRTDLVYMLLGQCLMFTKHYDEARNAFQEAVKDDRVATNARQFLRFNEELRERDRRNREALRALAAAGIEEVPVPR